MLPFHTAHLATETVDTTVLAVLFFTVPLEGKGFGRLSENSMYWYFVVWTWIPIYLAIYRGARAL